VCVGGLSQSPCVRNPQCRAFGSFPMRHPSRLNLSQIQFATAFGISVATVRNWEQGRRKPDGPARVLLRLAKHNPAAIIELTLRPASSRVAGPVTKGGGKVSNMYEEDNINTNNT
jgi:hypothetical protein